MKKSTIILLGFILLKFLLQYILLSPEYDLQRDEYLHLDQANHLAWGYVSVPPLTSWISLFIKLMGGGVFWVKFFPALFGALTIWVVWKIIEELGGDLFALVLGASAILFSVLLRLNTLYQPNSLDVLMWAACYYTLIKYIGTGKGSWLYAGAIMFALGFLNKYNIAFLAAGLLPSLLLTPQRRIFVQKEFYLAVLLCLLLILPNLVWQYQNHFPVVHHMKELAATQLVNVDRWGFLRSQVLFFLGSIFLIVAALYDLALYRPFRVYRSFFWAFFFTLAIFIYLKAKDYYAIGLYPVYIAFGSVYFSLVVQSGWKRFLKPVAVAVPVMFFVVMYNWAFPNKSPEYIIHHPETYKKLGLLHWEDGKDHVLPQDFADMLGWKELASKVDRAYSALPQQDRTLVLCDNYGEAGAINYYTKKGIRAVSFNADYVNWFRLDKPYVNVIRIKSDDNRFGEMKETSPFFHTSIISDSVANPYAREYKTTIFVFTGATVDVNKRIIDEIAKTQEEQ